MDRKELEEFLRKWFGEFGLYIIDGSNDRINNFQKSLKESLKNNDDLRTIIEGNTHATEKALKEARENILSSIGLKEDDFKINGI